MNSAEFGRERIGMEVVVRPIGAAVGDATNALGGSVTRSNPDA
jgi:hypothetical protein